MNLATNHCELEGRYTDMALDKIDVVLQDWADWMQYDKGPAGYPSRAAGIVAPSWIKDSEERKRPAHPPVQRS